MAALVLIVEAGHQRFVGADLMARTLELTPSDSQGCDMAGGSKSVRDVAEATGYTEASIYWHLNQIYRKESISRQMHLGAVGVPPLPSCERCLPLVDRPSTAAFG